MNQQVNLSLKPDIINLVGSDSLGQNGSAIIAQFIQTPSLKFQLDVSPIKIYLSSSEYNLGKIIETDIAESFFRNYFRSSEFSIVDNKSSADYILEIKTDTKEDISSEILNSTFNLRLASLSINIQLSKSNSDLLHKVQGTGIFGYGNSLSAAGMNAYSAEKLNLSLQELAFQIKRKIVNY